MKVKEELGHIIKKIRDDAASAEAVSLALNLEAEHLTRLQLCCDDAQAEQLLKCIKQECPDLFGPN